jgi:hypothetical protein
MMSGRTNGRDIDEKDKPLLVIIVRSPMNED